jgi:PAS domain S-box-containing protein
MPQPLRVLIIEDNARDAELVVRELHRAGFEPDWRRVDTEKDYVDNLNDDFDIILSDYAMPGFDGMRALELLKQRGLDTPFVIVSGTIGEDVAVQALTSGAADYLLKDRITRLGPAVERVLKQKRLRGERRVAERALTASEVSYRRLFEAAQDGILILDVHTGRIIDANPFLIELLGSSYRQMVGKTVGELSPFKDMESNKVMLERLQRDGYVRYEDLPLETKDGRHIAVEFVSNVYQAGDRKVIQCNIRDITARKEAEIASIRLASIIESSADAIIGKDLNGVITSWNKGAEKIFGYTASEMTGTSIMRLIPADRHDEENHILEKINRGESVEHFETLRQTKGGQLIDVAVTVSPIMGATGKVIGVSKVARDITARKRAEEALRLSERRYRRLFETAQDGILILDSNTRKITDANPFMSNLLDYRHDELLGKELWEIGLLKDEEASRSAFRELQEKHFIRYENLPLQNKNGLQYDVEFVSNLYDEDNRKVIQCNIRNITERKRAEGQMRDVQTQLEQTNRDLTKRSQEVQYFYHTLSHELKTPLTAAREFVSIVIDGLAGELNATQLNYLGIAKKSCTELAVYINDLLDATRLDTGKLHIELKAASLVAIIQRAIAVMEPVAAAKSIRLAEELDTRLMDVMVDESRIMQIVTNLLNNALKFTFEGGTIIVKLAEYSKSSECVQISVTDNGCGIAKDKIENLFHRFYQIKNGDATPEKGVGLGLYLCRELVLMHGGSIWVKSTLGKGSTFSFTIPKKAATKAAHVLVVDDDSEVREALRQVLEENGFGVATVAGGSEALQRMSQRIPDVVVLDLMMAGLDGPSTLKQIRKNLGPIPVIVHTGYPDGELMQRALESSPFTLLAKPCPPKQFVQTVSRICQQNQPLRPPPSTRTLNEGN